MASRRGYLSQTELAQYADITIDDTTEADDQITMAEELIDEYVGTQQKFLAYELSGLIASVASASVFTLEDIHQNNMQIDYLVGCWVEIIGGAGIGQKRKITGQTLAGVITVESAFSPTIDATSYYHIYQLGKFPRKIDVFYDSKHTPNRYYKRIPEEVTRAVAAQVEYVTKMGADFFGSDKINLESERIGDYAYTKGAGTGGVSQLIAPKAKLLLNRIINRTGAIID